MTSIKDGRRSKYTDLQPLATNLSKKNQAPVSRNPTSAPRKASLALPSPRILTAREFYRDHAAVDNYKVDDNQPRRHSLNPDGLTTRLGNVSLSTPTSQLPELVETENIQTDSIKQEKEHAPSQVKQNDLTKVGTIATRRLSDDTSSSSAAVLGPIPFQYAHDRLQTWGYVYLGNTETADAFINPVHLRRPSMTPSGGDEKSSSSSNHTVIRARVVPKDNERKPFLIQKQLDIEDLRSAIPPVANQPSSRDSAGGVAALRRSNRIRQSVNGSTPSQDQRRGSVGNTSMLRRNLISGAMPIHVEYALHYLPALGALMLSGHVRKGDSIDLPIPHPQAWREVLAYIYTGVGVITVPVKENILFLAGRVDGGSELKDGNRE